MRLSITLGMLCATLMWLAIGLGVVPDPFRPKLDGRNKFCKAVAVSIASYAENGQDKQIEEVLNRMVMSNDDLRSVGLRRASSEQQDEISEGYSFTAGQHKGHWTNNADSSINEITATIFANGIRWGTIEMRYRPISNAAGFLIFPFPAILFLGSSITLLTFLILSNAFRHLNPSTRIPGHVRSALDTVGEGLILVDLDSKIAHANRAFCRIVNEKSTALAQRRINELNWSQTERDLPWVRALTKKEIVTGQIVEYPTIEGHRKFLVNASPVFDSKSKCKGVICCFDDVTSLEEKREELGDLLKIVRKSREDMKRQNEKLNFLVAYDPLTECLNRRAFWTEYENAWKIPNKKKVSLMMIDIDHFKSINDTWGHSVGDKVLKETGAVLKEIIGNLGLVCRFGGEEFIVVTTNSVIDEAQQLAEKIVKRFQESKIDALNVTVSIGISNREFGAMDPQHLLDQADQSLYAAKRNGRNQVIRFDQCPADILQQDPSEFETDSRDPKQVEYSTVTGLISALAFRSLPTAEHSLRVADLAVTIGSNVMPVHSLYSLEIAALLHDIGKIGIPDSILNKPGRLTEQERETMAKHDKIGVEIVRSAFPNSNIANIITKYQQNFNEPIDADEDELLSQQEKLSARIIALCDAFDSMISKSLYRDAMPIAEALEELKRCSATQFDPALVTQLAQHIQEHGYSLQNNEQLSQTTRTTKQMDQHIDALYDVIESESSSSRIDASDSEEGQQSPADGPTGTNLDPASSTPPFPNDANGSTQVGDALSMADEVVEVCKSTRNSFSDTDTNVPSEPSEERL